MDAHTAVPQLPGYRDLSPLGRGGYSEVYRAYQDQFDRWVAVKVLAFTLVDDRAQRRFLRECRVAGRLSAHPNIVTVYDAGLSPDGRPYISMELYDRGSISDELRAGESFDVARVLRIAVSLAGALETAHRAGVVHRDVKPANVLLASYGQPALTDFGLSILTEHETSGGIEALTRYHAPPEVLERTAVTVASDVYSLASTTYAMLAGRAPHQRDHGNDTMASLLLRILQVDVPSIGRPDVPPSLDTALRVALDRDPDARTPTASAFAEALQRVQAEMGVEVTEPIVMDAPQATEVASPGPLPGLLDPSPAVTERLARTQAGTTTEPRADTTTEPLTGAPAGADGEVTAGPAAALDDLTVGTPLDDGPGPVIPAGPGPAAAPPPSEATTGSGAVATTAPPAAVDHAAPVVAGESAQAATPEGPPAIAIPPAGGAWSPPPGPPAGLRPRPGPGVRLLGGEGAVHRPSAPGPPPALPALRALRPRSRWRVPAIVAGLAVVGGLAATGGYLATKGGEAPEPGPSTTRPDRDDPGDDVAATVDLEVPIGLKATESPAGVQLEWDGHADDEHLVLVLSEAEEPRLLPAQLGTSQLVPATALRSGTGYCFAVAALSSLDRAPEGHAAEAFSSPVCIRGASEDTVRTG